MKMSIRVYNPSGKTSYHSDVNEIVYRYTDDELRKCNISIIINGVVVGDIDAVKVADEMTHEFGVG